MRSLLVGLLVLFAAPAAWAQGLSFSATSSVTFSALNPSVQPITPGSNTIVATVTLSSPKNHDTWNLSIRAAGANFTGPSGSPIAITNVSWTATTTVIDGRGTATAASGQGLTTSAVVVASGTQGNQGPFIAQI